MYGMDATPLPGFLHFTVDPRRIMMSVLSLSLYIYMTQPGIESRSTRPLANTLPTRPIKKK